MFIVLIRTVILFAMVTFSIRIMGKRQIGQLQPYELVVAIMISELASTHARYSYSINSRYNSNSYLFIIQIVISLLELSLTRSESL